MKAIDLFCGCGGLTAGLKAAGFQVLAGVDIEPSYIQSFRENFKDSQAIEADASNIDSLGILRNFGLKRGELDLLAGGPPCQGFSKNVPRSKRHLDSENNVLVNSFLAHCEAMLPKWVLMENVAEMRNGFDSHYTDEIVNRLESCGYKVIHGVHNAADYGVPQRRRRAFFIGRRDGINPVEPLATHAKSKCDDLFGSKLQHVSVWDAISDLCPLNSGEGVSPDEYNSEPLNNFQSWARSESDSLVYNHVAKKLAPKQQARINSLEPGQGIKDLPDDLRPKGGYSGAYGRLTKDMIMPTITRWVFHPGSGRWGHPVDKRLITIREAARLHGFKDSFVFHGSYTQQAGQLGNSVPPLLAEIMARSLLEQSS